jgi:hypothetical protein
MKRNTFLAAAAAVTLFAVPAMAQPYGGFGKERRVRPAPAPHVELPSVSSYGPHSAQAGATVTIYGSGFGPGAMVKLARDMITPTSINARRLTFQVPAGARDGALSVVLTGRRMTLPAGSFNVIAPARVAPRRGFYRDAGWFNTRGNRRLQSRRSIMSRWNNRAFLASPQTSAELAFHGRRLAKLNRMKRLARATGKFALTARIDRTISRENARHDRKMKQLERTFVASYRPAPRRGF